MLNSSTIRKFADSLSCLTDDTKEVTDADFIVFEAIESLKRLAEAIENGKVKTI